MAIEVLGCALSNNEAPYAELVFHFPHHHGVGGAKIEETKKKHASAGRTHELVSGEF